MVMNALRERSLSVWALIERLRDKPVSQCIREQGTALKVSLMLLSLFWMLIYRLSASSTAVPEFVYVNF